MRFRTVSYLFVPPFFCSEAAMVLSPSSLLEAFAEAAVHRLLLQCLGRRVYLQVVVFAVGVHLLQLDGLLLVVMHNNRPGIGIDGAVGQGLA